MLTTNPYNYNLPVGSGMFFGRRRDVDALMHHLTVTPGDSIALIGGRRMGKTSLLEALLRALESMADETDNGILPLPVFLDLTGEHIDSVVAFFSAVSQQAGAAMANLLSLPESALAVELGQPPAPTFGRMLENWGQAAVRHWGHRLRLILLLDECEQIIEHPWTPRLYGSLRYLLVGRTTRSLFKVVMAGSHHFLTEVRQHGSPLRNVLTYYKLQVLDEQATRDLIIQPTQGALSDDVTQTVTAQSGGHPFLTQYLMFQLWEQGLESVTSETVWTLSTEFHHSRGDFQDWTDSLTNSSLRVYSVLSQATEALDEDQVQAAVDSVLPDLPQALDALCYHGLVVREESGNYRLTGDMFREWFMANALGYLESEASQTESPTPPNVSVSLLTRAIPTAYCHHLDAAAFPLVTVLLDNTDQSCTDAEMHVSASIEGYGDITITSPSVPHGASFPVSVLPVLQHASVATLNEIRPATLRVTVQQSWPAARTLYDETTRIELHARDTALLAVRAPDGTILDLTDYLVAWVTPHRPELERLLRQAAEHHPERQFVGYQGASTLSEATTIVEEQARAIFDALKEDANLIYVNSPVSFGAQESQITQRVRLPTESLAAGSSANCIDGTVLFASLLELADIDPVIVIVPGHAFVGWRVWQGMDDYHFLETTMIGSDDFDAAQQSGQTLYEEVLEQGYFDRELFDPDGFARLIDIAACRVRGIYPLE